MAITISKSLEKACAFIKPQDKLRIADELKITPGYITNIMRRVGYNEEVERYLIEVSIKRMKDAQANINALLPEVEQLKHSK